MFKNGTTFSEDDDFSGHGERTAAEILAIAIKLSPVQKIYLKGVAAGMSASNRISPPDGEAKGA
jgi:hypothetical protein